MTIKNGFVSLAIAAFLTICCIGLNQHLIARHWELKTLDLRYQWRGFKVADERITLVGIDDQAINFLGKWEWPRSIHAAFLQTLSNNPPQACGFDLVFRDKSNNLEADQQLVSVSKLFDDLVYAAYFQVEETIDKEKADESLLKKIELGSVKNGFLPEFKVLKPELPFDALARSAKFAFINAPHDIDGAIREIPLVIAYQGKFYPSFALEMILSFFDIEHQFVEVKLGDAVKFGTHRIPIDQEGNFIVNYRSDLKNFKRINYLNVLKEPDIKMDQMLLVGLMATGSTDLGPTPLSSSTPLLLVHANAIQNILQEDYLKKMSLIFQWGIIFLFFWVIAFIGICFSVVASGFAALFGIFSYSAFNIFMFNTHNIWMQWGVPIFGMGIIYIVTSSFHYFVEEKNRRSLKKAFQRFVSPSVLKEILKDPENLKLGGEERDVSILFSDIRGFSTYCENRKPQDVVDILNEYFDVMTKVILKEGGVLDKYMGDGLMALFGVPVHEEPHLHAIKAVRAAIQMQENLSKLKEKWILSGKDPFNIGIGIHTGRALVGHMGSTVLMNYTAIGDEVNLASRVEGQTIAFNKEILITEATYKHVQNIFKCERLNEVKVKGRERSVMLYSVSRKTEARK